jgi:hypothetical protein
MVLDRQPESLAAITHAEAEALRLLGESMMGINDIAT